MGLPMVKRAQPAQHMLSVRGVSPGAHMWRVAHRLPSSRPGHPLRPARARQQDWCCRQRQQWQRRAAAASRADLGDAPCRAAAQSLLHAQQGGLRLQGLMVCRRLHSTPSAACSVPSRSPLGDRPTSARRSLCSACHMATRRFSARSRATCCASAVRRLRLVRGAVSAAQCAGTRSPWLPDDEASPEPGSELRLLELGVPAQLSGMGVPTPAHAPSLPFLQLHLCCCAGTCSGQGSAPAPCRGAAHQAAVRLIGGPSGRCPQIAQPV